MDKIIFTTIASNINHNTKSWLVTVINTDGSTPARIGMKMLIDINGKLQGTIGGGAIEKIVVDKILQDQPNIVVKWAFDLGNNPNSPQIDMICGGNQEILIDPLFNHSQLYIIGGGHCGTALCELAAKCEFNITIIDDRKEIAATAKHPFANQVIHTPYEHITTHIQFNPNIFIVIMTHAHKHDQLVIEKILNQEYKYLGVLGSEHKINSCFERLLQKGFAVEKLNQIHAPIGIKIGSHTPTEIAISILAQMLAIKNEKQTKL